MQYEVVVRKLVNARGYLAERYRVEVTPEIGGVLVDYTATYKGAERAAVRMIREHSIDSYYPIISTYTLDTDTYRWEKS